MRRYKNILIGFLVACGIGSVPANADEPEWDIEDYLNSTILTIRIYTIRPEQFGTFIDTAVSNGPFTSRLGGFVNEKILEPVSTNSAGDMNVIMISRYFDEGTSQIVNMQRDPSLREISGSDPVTINAKLVENNFGNWSWETGDQASRFQLENAAAYDTKRIMDNEELSVSFGKSGYVGQAGMLESFSGDTSIESIRKELSSRADIAGASIFKADGGYLVYSEYFQATEGLASKELALSDHASAADAGAWFTGGQLGVVTSNYGGR